MVIVAAFVVVIVAAFTTWVAWRAAVLIVRAAPWVLVRRMTWIAALRTVTYALIAFFFTFAIVTSFGSATNDGSTGHCYSSCCQGITIEGSASEGDRCTCIYRSHELRICQCCGLNNIPSHIAWHCAVGQNHIEVGACKSTSRRCCSSRGINRGRHYESISTSPVERQCASLCCCIDIIGARCKYNAIKSAGEESVAVTRKGQTCL